ncbi:MAG: DUF4268 domain-containing protein [Chitinophagales bacterium]|nr:DUF4268 domain-containing protein [Chitinophagales bacterium]
MNLGKLQKLELKSVWKHEAQSFTPWLAREENIAILGDEIGIDLEVQSQEERVGPFRADIFCKDTANDRYVLIENQLEKTDHTHLGQIMTYAAGLNAVTIIWISSKFTEEHRAALDWLNNITDESVEFFGIEVELYRIGNSDPAPKFSIVSKPNDWSRTIRRRAANAELSDTKQEQLAYWTAFKEFAEAKGTFLRLQKPSPQHWYAVSIGRSGFHLSGSVNSQKNLITVQLVMMSNTAKTSYQKLYSLYYEDSMKVLGDSLLWDELPDAKSTSTVYQSIPADLFDKSSWKNQHQWMLETLERFHKYFRDKVRNI